MVRHLSFIHKSCTSSFYTSCIHSLAICDKSLHFLSSPLNSFNTEYLLMVESAQQFWIAQLICLLVCREMMSEPLTTSKDKCWLKLSNIQWGCSLVTTGLWLVVIRGHAVEFWTADWRITEDDGSKTEKVPAEEWVREHISVCKRRSKYIGAEKSCVNVCSY